MGRRDKFKFQPAREVIDLRAATVLPGLIDAHTHMFNARKPDGTTEDYMLIAAQNVQFNAASRASPPRAT